MSGRIVRADSYVALALMAEASVDAIVCDPPYMLGFMGKAFDNPHDNPADDPAFWRLALRVLKPGGHLLAFGGTRTYHRMATAIEDAGFEIRDSLAWLYGSGFPKSHNVGKALNGSGEAWAGWGTALKPAHEPVVVARKPLGSTVAACVLEHGTGAINVDGCRVPTPPRNPGFVDPDSRGLFGGVNNGALVGYQSPAGRWPPNVLLGHAPECELVGERQVRGRNVETGARGDDVAVNCYGDGLGGRSTTTGLETVADWRCAPGCPVAEVGRQSGERPAGVAVNRNKDPRECSPSYSGGWRHLTEDQTYGDTGTAARFYPQFSPDAIDADPLNDANGSAAARLAGDPGFLYNAKASRTERGLGVSTRNAHPT